MEVMGWRRWDIFTMCCALLICCEYTMWILVGKRDSSSQPQKFSWIPRQLVVKYRKYSINSSLKRGEGWVWQKLLRLKAHGALSTCIPSNHSPAGSSRSWALDSRLPAHLRCRAPCWRWKDLCLTGKCETVTARNSSALAPSAAWF